jgi:steroid 5-alpha reductase family enzyme
MDNIFEMLGAGFFLVLALMSALWLVYFFKRNAGILDIGWPLSFMLVMAAYLFIGEGDFLKKGLLACMVWGWGGRLAWHLYRRYQLSEEDVRYQRIRSNWGDHPDSKFFMLFVFQGVLAVFLTLPFLIVAYASNSTWYGVEAAGFLVWIIGVIGEGMADQALKQFQSDPENKGKVCKKGWWRYSRHPNYFFEFVVWVGYFLFALGSPGGWMAIISPAIILVLLTKISGIPQTEAEALKSKGEDYRLYQKKTSSFVPWFPEEDSPKSPPGI